ncbi:MAG TPA: FtsX-like permease family protein [Ktedonobacteraceae bacterium]|nr:FtsX-like permease family protein [Ktedonobacteraceae bacterium]
MPALTKKVFRDISHRKARTLLTVIGIAIGIIGLSAINIASSQFKSSLEYSSNVTSQADIQIYTNPTSPTLASTIQQQPNVLSVQAQGSIVTRWAIGQDHELIQVLGILDFEHMQINRFKLVEGHLPGPGQVILDESDHTLADIHIGDTISIQVGATYKPLTISGFVVTQGRPQAALAGRAYGYMNEPSFETFFNRPGVTNFALRVKDYDQRYQTLTQISQVMDQHQTPILGSDVGRDDSVSQIADGLFGIMNVLSVIAIVLSVILLLGTIMALITEQIQAIGTMKAVGAARGKIMRHYLALVSVYAAIGTAIGLILGIAGGYLLARYLGGLVSLDIGPLQVAPWQIIEAAIVGIGTPLLAALIPVYLGTRVTVKQALSGYGLENTANRGNRGWARISRFVLGWLPQTFQFGTRGVFRKRLRTALTLLTLAVSGAAFLAVQTANYSFNTFLNQVYTVYHFDVMVSLDDDMPLSRFQQVLSPVNGVGRIESFSQDKATTDWGDAALTGVQTDTQLYQRKITTGRWFTNTDHNVVIISQDAADKSGLKVGNMLTFTIGLHTVHWQIIGIASDFSDIGPGNFGVLLAPISQINAMFAMPGDYSQKVMIQSTIHAPTQADLDDLARRVDTAMSNAGFLPDVVTAQDQINQAQSKYQTIYTLLDLVAIVIALVGSVGLANTLVMSVLERRREIGILRSMGAASRKVAQVFWAEGTTLGGLAWLLALVLGFPAAWGLLQIQAKLLAPVPFAFNPYNLVWMFLAIFILASLACIGPVFAATRVKIVQTLRYE